MGTEQDLLLKGQKTGSFLESRHSRQFFSYQLFNKHCLSTDSASGALNALRNGDLHELEKQQPILPKEEKKANWWLRGSGKMRRINYY